MGSLLSEPARNTQKAERSLANNQSDIKSAPEPWNDQKLTRSTTERSEQSIYGHEFKHCATGRPGTVHFPLSRAIVGPETYQKRPKKFTAAMKIDYQLYKDVAESSSMMGADYNQIIKSYGGLQNMTETQHRDMLELCKGTFDEHARRLQPSPMALEYKRSVCSRTATLLSSCGNPANSFG